MADGPGRPAAGVSASCTPGKVSRSAGNLAWFTHTTNTGIMALRRSERPKKTYRKDDFEYGHGWSLPRTRVERKTPREESDSWPILEVIRRVDEHHVEVKWAPTTRVWPNSIVDLPYNPQLADALVPQPFQAPEPVNGLLSPALRLLSGL
ncbi:hypothetical protein Bbelb_283050 [Branchiostoma belcheri]|nr:hypothetical protein Bbelb_283050 [Branchiostoma belcheri]